MIPLSKIDLPFPIHAKGKGQTQSFTTDPKDAGGVLAERIERDADTVYITRGGVTVEVPWQQCKLAVRAAGSRQVDRLGYSIDHPAHPPHLTDAEAAGELAKADPFLAEAAPGEPAGTTYVEPAPIPRKRGRPPRGGQP